MCIVLEARSVPGASFRKYGLSYVDPDPVAHVVFPDGEYLTMWLELDRTCAEIARVSETDAMSYRRLLAEYDEIKAIVGPTRFRSVGYGPSAQEALADHPRRGV